MTDLAPIQATEEHYRICRPWFENREITKWLISPLRLGRYLRILHDRLVLDRGNRVFFIHTESRPIGVAGFRGIDRIDHKAEVWYLIGDERDRGRNHASEALSFLSSHSATRLGLVSLYAQVSALNGASVRVLEKNGYRYAGRLRRCFQIDGDYQDLLLYDWIRENVMERTTHPRGKGGP